MDKQNRNIQIVLLSTICLIATRAKELDAYSILVPEFVSPVYTMVSTNEPKHTPRITFERTNVKLGNIRPNKNYKCSFPFKNTGKSLLEIKGIQSTCRCSTPELTKKEYAPGESGEIIVQFLSSSLEGNSEKNLYVLSNDPETARSKLIITANVVFPFEVKPEKLELDCRKADFGAVPIIIRCKDGKSFGISGFSSPDECITANFDPAHCAIEHIIHPKINAKTIRKRPSGYIQIQTTHPEFSFVSLRYAIQSEFKIFPRRIVFFNVVPEEKYTREISVKNNYGENFRITSVKSIEKQIEVLHTDYEGSNAKLTIMCCLPVSAVKAGYLSDDLEICVDDEQVFKIPCTILLSDMPDERVETDNK